MTIDISLEQRVERELRVLHIGGKLQGLRHLIYAVTAAVRDPSRTDLLTKDLYHEIARAHGTKAIRVERNMRTAICVCWSNADARKTLDQMAGYHLVKRPSNKEFIDLVAFHIRST